MFFEVIVFVILIALSAFFSGAEIALFSLGDIRVRKLVRQRRRGAKLLRKLKDNPHRLLVTILLCNNLVNITAAALATVTFTAMFGSGGIGIATGIMTFVLLIFGEITPKSYCHHNAEKVSLVVVGPIYVLTKVLFPFVITVEKLSLGMLRLVGHSRKRQRITEDDIKSALSMGAELGVIDEDEEEMIRNIFDFGDTRVSEVMVPRREMVAIRSDRKLGDALMKMLDSRYSRMPVYKEKFDNIIGVIHIKDMLKHVREKSFDMAIEEIVSPVMFVDEGKKLDDLMDDFRERGIHLAIVRTGRKVKGLVTFEDLLEEIVGEIYDESDVKDSKLRRMDEKSMIVDAGASISEIRKATGIDFGQKNLKTISELFVSKTGRMPRKGDCIRFNNFRIIVKDTDSHRIKRVKIVKKKGKIGK
ncbi:MAG: hemolysin family protein [Candidatus Aenigmatarchaeota archaeon]